MAGKDSDYRIFVGGLSWDVTERQLEDAFSRFGKIIDAQMDWFTRNFGFSWIALLKLPVISMLCFVQLAVFEIEIMLERDTGRPRGFGFLTFSDRRGMEDAIREMHGSDFGERVISVNKAQPKMAGDDLDRGYGGGSYPSGGGRGSGYGGGDRSMGQDECFKCGRSGHWARDCPSAGGGSQFPSRPRFGGAGGRGDRYADRDRYVDDRYDAGRFGDKDRYDSRDSKYGSRSRYATERYPPSGGDRFGSDRYGVPDRYPPPPPPSAYGRDRDYDRDVIPRRSSDRYGGGGGPARYEGRSYRDRAGPYDRPKRGGGRPASFDY